ncbi:hypothetical protein M3Y99_00244200 [Aphelenchoides fujianensis]|nr:hypothetical protein M3Y99_00244200 [Aphelenchoides fujianensis]
MSQPTAPKREAPSVESEVRPPVQPPPKKPKKNEQEPKRGARLRDEFDRLRALIDERRPGAPPCRASDQADVLEKARALIVETEQRAKFYEFLFYAARFEATNRVQRASLLGFRMGAHFLYQRQHLGQPQLNAQMTALDEAADGMGVRMPPVPPPLPNWAAFFAPPQQPPIQPPFHSFDPSMPPLLPQQPTVSHNGHPFFQPQSQPMPLPAFPPTSAPWMPFVNAPMIPTLVPPAHHQQPQQPQPIVPHASVATQQLVIPPVVPPTPQKPAVVSQQSAIVKPQPLTARQQAAAVPPTPKKPPVGLPPLVLPSAVEQPAIPVALKPPPIRRIVLNAIPPRVAPAGGLVLQHGRSEEEAAPAPETTEAEDRPIGPVPRAPPPSPASQQPKESPPPTPTPPFVPTASSSSSSSFPSHVFEDPAFQASAAAGFGQNGGQVRPFAPPNFDKFAASIQNVLNSAVAEESGTGPQ